MLPVLGLLFFIASGCVAAPANLRSKLRPHQALFQGPQVFLTVSSQAGYRNEGGETILLDRMLELNWNNFDNQANDRIGLFTENPDGMNSSDLDTKVVEEYPANATGGSYKTSVRYARISLNATMERCLGFWAAYLRTENNQTVLLMSSCLTVYPTWMHDLSDQIKDVPLHSLMIPGTHNAGSWIYYQGLPSEGVLIEYTYCHEDSIYEQFIHGIRALDIRVAYYPNTDEKFYINHDQVRVRPLQTLIDDVKRFVQETNEIIFMDFHRFPVGFTSPEVHAEFVAYLREQLGDIVVPKSLTLSATPQQLWDLGKTVMLFYVDDATQVQHDILWQGVDQAWADTNNMEDLESYHASAVEQNGCQRKAWSAMAQLTPTAQDIILRPTFGLRGFANLANRPITQWYQREAWYSKSMIVALDFYLGTDVIATAVEVNKNHGNLCV